MPRFKVTAPDGRSLTLTGDSAPTEQELEQIFSTIQPVKAVEPTQEAEGPSLLGRILTPVQRVASTLGRPGAAVAAVAKEGVEGFQQQQDVPSMLKDMGQGIVDTLTPTGLGTWKRNDDFDKVLGQAGMEEGWARAGLGLVGDVVLDPTFAGPGARLFNKGVSTAIGGGLKAVDKATDMVGLAPAKKALARTFDGEDFSHLVDTRPDSATTGLDYGSMKRLAASTGRAEGEHAQKFAEDFFGRTGIKAEDQTKLLYAIDEGRLTGDPNLDALIPEWKAKMDELHQIMVQRGWVKQNQKVKDYVRYLTRSGRPADAVVGSATQALPGAANTRKAKSLKQAVTEFGATDDAQEVLAKTIAQVNRAARKEDFLTEVKGAFGSEVAQPGYRKIQVDRLKIGDKMKATLKDVHLPEELADDLERAVVLWENPDELNGIYVNSMKILKSVMTSINPGHHFTNAYGNIHNMYVGGMKGDDIVKGLWESSKIAQAAEKGVEQGMAAMPKIGNYTPDQLWNAARDYEILGTSSILGETNAKGSLEKVANNVAFQYARKFGTKRVEEPSRLAFFLDRVRKGDTPAQAAIKTKNVLFDYAELTPWEKKVRDLGVIPFYTWMRKNIPLQLKAIKENPSAVEKVGDLTEAPWNAERSETEQSVLPESGQMAGYMPSPIQGPDGLQVFQRLNLPVLDLNRITESSMIGDSLGPLPKALVERGMGRRFYGGDIERPTGMAPPAPLAALLGLGLNPLLPESMEGYVTPAQTPLGPMQHDTMSWLMGLMPAGFYGSAAQMATGQSPRNPQVRPSLNTAMRMLGATPDVLSPEDQQYAAQDKVKEYKRQLMRKVLMEK